MEMAGNDINPVPQELIKRFKDILEKCENKPHLPLIDCLRRDFKKLDKDNKEPSKLTVAVYGAMGSGKSSLVNAILDEPNLLRTDSMAEACTKVAFKIERKDRDEYSAEIEFLEEEEWNQDLDALIGDLEEPEPDGGQSYSTVYKSALDTLVAVYGEFDKRKPREVIEADTEIRGKLGTKYSIPPKNRDTSSSELGGPLHNSESVMTAKSLQDELWRYLEEGNKQLWPIVKEITLRLPNSDLNSRDIVLIDLPGVGDSNLAREKVAKKNMRNSDVLMVVTEIKRAVDNKTAKDLIGEDMFRKIKMDGYKTVLVCTHTDEIVVEDVLRKVHLPDVKEKNKTLTEQQKKKKKEKGSGTENEVKELKDKIEKLEKEIWPKCAAARNTYVKQKVLSSIDGRETLEVFCVSSTEHHALNPKSSDSEDNYFEAKTFQTDDQTEIPLLQDFLEKSSEQKRNKKRSAIIADFQFLVSALSVYLTNIQLCSVELKDALMTEVKKKFDKFESESKEMIEQKIDIDEHLDTLYTVLGEGVGKAENAAEKVYTRWSNEVKTTDRSSGGFKWNTYRAAVSRDGKYVSKDKKISVDMNMDLCRALKCHIEKEWLDSFRKNKWMKLIDKRAEFLNNLADVTNEVHDLLVNLPEFCADSVAHNLSKLQPWMEKKLDKLDTIWKEKVQRKSREIDDNIPDHIKEKMKPTYALCRHEKGKGSFRSMKNIMKKDIDDRKKAMFEDLEREVRDSLEEMKDEVVNSVSTIFLDVCEYHRKQIEAPWEGQSFEGIQNCKGDLAQLLVEVDELDKNEDSSKGTKRKREDGEEGQSSSK